MNDNELLSLAVDALDNIAAEMERLRVLKEYELGVRLQQDEGGEPYVPEGEE